MDYFHPLRGEKYQCSAKTMKLLLQALISALVLSPFGYTAELVPADGTVIFPAEKAAGLVKAVCYTPPNADGYWTPTLKDLEGVEGKLVDYLTLKQAGGEKDWAGFRKQIAGLRRGNDTLIFISYFYVGTEEDLLKRKALGIDPDEWKRVPYWVLDGGDFYFRVLYDAKKKQFVWFEQNGEA